jgi:hypothetical protein
MGRTILIHGAAPQSAVKVAVHRRIRDYSSRGWSTPSDDSVCRPPTSFSITGANTLEGLYLVSWLFRIGSDRSGLPLYLTGFNWEAKPIGGRQHSLGFEQRLLGQAPSLTESQRRGVCR